MNKDFMLSNLREARDEISKIIQDIETDPDYEQGSYGMDMTHLYHHINTAWNARDASEAEVIECTEENFIKWRQHPNGDEIYLGP